MIPDGHARARSQQGWLADVREHPGLQLRRGDAQEHILAVARELAMHAAWETRLTRPTWAVLMDRTGLSRRAVARHLAWLRSAGLLALVAGGTTADLSPGILRGRGDVHDRNEASVYVLMAPSHLRLVAVSHPDDLGYEHVVVNEHGEIVDPDGPQDDPEPPPLVAVDRSGTPTGFGFDLFSPRGRAREKSGQSGAGLRPALQERPPQRRANSEDTPEEPRWVLGDTPAGKQERLAAAAEARRRLPALRSASVPGVASLLREWHLAGWSLHDVLHALATQPDGTPWSHAHGVRHVPGWTRHRLAPWRVDPTDPTSSPGPSPTARAERRAVHHRAIDRARADRHAADVTAATPAPPDVRAAARAAAAAGRATRARVVQRPCPPPGGVPGDATT